MTRGEPISRKALRDKAPHEVAALLGHDLSEGGGISIEDHVVIVHLPGESEPVRIEHQIEG